MWEYCGLLCCRHVEPFFLPLGGMSTPNVSPDFSNCHPTNVLILVEFFFQIT